VDTEQATAGRELARLEARITELQARARLLRDEIAGDATFRELLVQVDPQNDARERHARHIGRNLRRIREDRELSQRQLGMLLGYASGQRISYWELGRKAPGPRSLERLACVLEVHWTDFYSRHVDG
jgi:DNA-binding transcriptional regulator YiaG